MGAPDTSEVHIGVDVGGTFTDAVLVAGGALHVAKVPTTPHDQGEGVIAAVERVLTLAGRPATSVTHFAHGMTVGTNALLEGTGAPIALVATEGFGDVSALRRQDRAHLYRLDAHHPPPLVPAERRVEVRERCGPDGVIVPLDEESVDGAVAAIGAMGVEAVAVCLLFSFRHPAHEQQIGRRLRERLPGVHVSLSSEVLPEIREYERTSTTCVDAHLSPLLGRYLDGLGRRARAIGLREPVIMQSSGGTLTLDRAAAHAAETVLSGPAGGVIGAAAVAAAAGMERVLTFDMGGTSCDVALVQGEPERTTQTTVAGHALHLPMLDIHTVSAGGGSIAWIDSGGALRVGPQSAGARPGPACYGRGGTAPTVTDANLVLGRLDPATRLGGGLALDSAAAAAAVGRLAQELDLGVDECARGVVAVAVEEMARALRVVSVERGIDPRDMALVAFGGAGPLHACDVADAIGIRTVLVPAAAGVLAALGLVVAGERRDLSRTVLLALTPGEELEAAVRDLRDRGRATLPDAAHEWAADCRYRGQAHEITVPWDPDAEPAMLRDAFDAAHRRRSGGSDPTRPVELVTIRLALVRPGRVPDVELAPVALPAGDSAAFALDGATGWVSAGWNAEAASGGGVVLRR